MRILIDESLPRKLAIELSGHDVQTVQKQGWAGLKNGELLRRAAADFEVLVTGDQNLEHQQNLAKLSIAVVVSSPGTIVSKRFVRWFRACSRLLQPSNRANSLA